MVEDFSPLHSRSAPFHLDNVPEMVERVARALAAQSFEAAGNDKPGPSAAAERRWPHFVPQARTAIEAMREPTEAMLRASPLIGTGITEKGDWATNTRPAQAVWPAMIDAALSSS